MTIASATLSLLPTAAATAPTRGRIACACGGCSDKMAVCGPVPASIGGGKLETSPQRRADSVELSSTSSKSTDPAAPKAAGGVQSLTDDERKRVAELKKRDAEVRQHEAAHLAAAGGHARGGPSYDYQTGPDGRRYAVGGHVDVDTSAVAGNPAATVAKMQTIRRAALAPANPSGQDRAVAAQAAAQAAKAQAELSERRGAEGAQDAAASPRGKGYGPRADSNRGRLIDIAG